VEKKSKNKVVQKTNYNRSQNHRLTSADIEHFKKLLLEKRGEILGNVNQMEDEALRKSGMDATGNLSSMPIHMADLGSDNFEQEFALGLMDSERKLLKEIDEALLRMEQGTYGICLGFNRPISKARLDAQPWTKYSIEYAQILEKGRFPENNRNLQMGF
jgi:RNA polymerase-binding protein DksA